MAYPSLLRSAARSGSKVEMAAHPLLNRFSAARKQVLLLLVHPRQFVSSSGFASGHPPTAELFGWMVACGSILLGLYSLALGSPLEKALKSAHLLGAPRSATPASTRAEPVTFAGLRWMAGSGFGVDFPQRRPFTEPQRADFQFGAVRVRLKNVVPQNVVEKSTAKVLVCTLCRGVCAMHSPGRPPARRQRQPAR